MGGGNGGEAGEESGTENGCGSIGILTWSGGSARVSLSIHLRMFHYVICLPWLQREKGGDISKTTMFGARELPADAVDHSTVLRVRLHTSLAHTTLSAIQARVPPHRPGSPSFVHVTTSDIIGTFQINHVIMISVRVMFKQRPTGGAGPRYDL